MYQRHALAIPTLAGFGNRRHLRLKMGHQQT
jgi:hypothetical protein